MPPSAARLFRRDSPGDNYLASILMAIRYFYARYTFNMENDLYYLGVYFISLRTMYREEL